MFYIAVEKQATLEIRTDKNKTIMAPAFMTGNLPEGGEFIPVFLSRLHAYVYLKPLRLFHEFKVVPINSAELSTYRIICDEEKRLNKNLYPISCRLVLGIGVEDKEPRLGYFNKSYNLSDIFLDKESLLNEVCDAIGSRDYQVIINEDKLNDHEIVIKGDNIIQKLGVVIKESNSITETSTNQTPSQQDFDSMYGYILVDKNFGMYGRKENGIDYIFAFINKLDAAIFATFHKEQSSIECEPVSLKDKTLIKILKLGQVGGHVKFKLVLGFLGAVTSVGNSWAKYAEDQVSPALSLVNCDFDQVENGFDLSTYFKDIYGEKETDQAITGLIMTNLASKESLVNAAKKFIADMKSNIITVSENDPQIYPRLIFLGD